MTQETRTKAPHEKQYVEALQDLLEVKPDGKFGPGTEQKVRTYQQKHYILSPTDPRGEVGPQTWRKLIVKDYPLDPEKKQYFGENSANNNRRDVRRIQLRVLAEPETERFGPIGKYGPKTARAVRGYQGRNNLKSDGKVGKKTWRRMFRQGK